GFPDTETADQFGSDDYRILVVAEKFQTGFDQPLLHTMFVDKRLFGVNAVQTLSRLNRTHGEKDDTFVLDFVNTADEIQRSFAPFYDVSLAAPTDPNELYDSWAEVERFGVTRTEDMEAFARVYFGADPNDRAVQPRLYAFLEPGRDRFIELDPEDQEECRTALKRFVARYGFISQIIPMTDTRMERRYAYCRHLVRLLPARPDGSLDLGDQVQLTHLRVAKTGDFDVSLTKGEGVLVAFPGDGPGGYDPTLSPLSELIDRLNRDFGANLTKADRLHLEGIVADMAADPTMQQQAAANTPDNFKIEFDKKFEGAVAARMRQAEDLTIRILDDEQFRQRLAEALSPRLYEEARVAYQKTCPIGDLLPPVRTEDQHLEYKSTLRWDLKENAKSRLVESATIKTVAAFLNSRFGGTLLIGVGDDGSIVGLDHDYVTVRKEGKVDADVFLLHLNQLLENAVGLAAAANVTTFVHHVDSHDICRVHVDPCGFPVRAEVTAADGKGQFSKRREFFVRLNNGTRAIEDDGEFQRYIAQRWGKEALENLEETTVEV
ncbi:MAG TPA: RNA-binding domain-containing protein, partial [Actinomycetota bacterium]